MGKAMQRLYTGRDPLPAPEVHRLAARSGEAPPEPRARAGSAARPFHRVAHLRERAMLPTRSILGQHATAQSLARLREVLGLDRPLHEQYFLYISDLLQGDLGNSLVNGRPVLQEFMLRFPATIELTLVALLFAVGIGIPSVVEWLSATASTSVPSTAATAPRASSIRARSSSK